MRRGILFVLGTGAILALIIAVGVRVPAVQDRIVRVAIGRLVASQQEELFRDDVLRVLLCGTASPRVPTAGYSPTTACSSSCRSIRAASSRGSCNDESGGARGKPCVIPNANRQWAESPRYAGLRSSG